MHAGMHSHTSIADSDDDNNSYSDDDINSYSDDDNNGDSYSDDYINSYSDDDNITCSDSDVDSQFMSTVTSCREPLQLLHKLNCSIYYF